MDINEFETQSHELHLQPQADNQKISPTSSPSQKPKDEASFPLSKEGTHFDDDLMKEFDKKHTELSSFLQDIPPSSGSAAQADADRMSVSPQDLDSPNTGLPHIGGDIFSTNANNQSANLLLGDDHDDPFGLNLNNSNQKDTSQRAEEISFGKVNGKTEGERSDAKLLQDLLDQANNFGGSISPDSLHTDDLLGLDKSPAKSSQKDDQVVPPALIPKEEKVDEIMSIHTIPQSYVAKQADDDSFFDRSSESPMDFGEPKLPDSPCRKPPSPVTTTVAPLPESPKLPETPCFKPPSPEVTAFQEVKNVNQDIFDIEPMISAKSEPEVMSSPSKPVQAEEKAYDFEKDFANEDEDYRRRETKTFDSDGDLIGIGKNKFESADKQIHQEFGGGDLPPSPPNIMDQNENDNDDIPPPIPKHSWELERENPPPVPPHSITSGYSSVGFHSTHASTNDFPIHASYDDKIDDEFDEDSLSKPLSHKLSDSLEVLKESPQRDHPLDESLMDLDDLPSSSKNSVKSISPNDSKNILGDFSGADGDVSAPVTSLPSEMTESGLFSQQPPKDLDSDSLDIDDKIDFKQAVADVEYTTATTVSTNKPIASITPFSAKTEGMLGDAPLASTMTSSMIMNTSLDEMQAPKFYESEDSSSKTDAPADEMEKAQTEPDRNLELQEFDEAIPESMEESGTPASDSGSSKIEVLEMKPVGKADLESVSAKELDEFEETQQEQEEKVDQPKQKIELDTDAFELSEEMQLLLNTLKPRTWFEPSKLHPTVSELVYWRDPKKSGAVFGSILIVLLALSLMSLISVVAYTSLAVLSGTFAFRVYKSVLQAVQKTQDGHPFKEYLELDIAVPSDKAQEISNAIINYANSAILQLRRLFLVEDLVDSAKFGLVLYLLTYIGGWFNGLTLLILGFLALFSLPKVYETNKTVIDQYLELINSKISEVTAKVTTAVPFLKKEKAQ